MSGGNDQLIGTKLGLIVKRGMADDLGIEKAQYPVKAHTTTLPRAWGYQKVSFIRLRINTDMSGTINGRLANTRNGITTLLYISDRATNRFAFLIGTIGIRKQAKGAEITGDINRLHQIVSLNRHRVGKVQSVINILERFGNTKNARNLTITFYLS